MKIPVIIIILVVAIILLLVFVYPGGIGNFLSTVSRGMVAGEGGGVV